MALAGDFWSGMFWGQSYLSRSCCCCCNVLVVECCFTSTETIGLLGTGAQDGHFDFHTAPELCNVLWVLVVLETVFLAANLLLLLLLL